MWPPYAPLATMRYFVDGGWSVEDGEVAQQCQYWSVHRELTKMYVHVFLGLLLKLCGHLLCPPSIPTVIHSSTPSPTLKVQYHLKPNAFTQSHFNIQELLFNHPFSFFNTYIMSQFFAIAFTPQHHTKHVNYFTSKLHHHHITKQTHQHHQTTTTPNTT